MTWNASVVLCDYLETHAPTLLHHQRVGDLSSGNGLVAVCLACLNTSSVVATETKDCTTLTRQNIRLNHVEDLVSVHTYYWGSAVDINQFLQCSLVTMCDLLYIAIRDGLETEFETTIRELCHQGCTVYFAFEQRLQEEEQAFLKRLQAPEGEAVEGEATTGAAPGIGRRRSVLDVVQIDPDELNVHRLGPTSEDSVEALLWEAPDIKMYIISGKNARH
jgi:predicted nicotinamide N-methyase